MQHGVATSGERFTIGVAVEDTEAVVCSTRKASCRDTTMTRHDVCERENAHTGVTTHSTPSLSRTKVLVESHIKQVICNPRATVFTQVHVHC